MNKTISMCKSASRGAPVAVSPKQVARAIIEGKYRTVIEAIREAVAAGNKQKATRLKALLVYICYTGVFERGHRKSDLRRYRSCCVLDYDNVPPAELARLRELAMQQPCVEMAYISASGRGLKVVVITDSTLEHHPVAYMQTAAYFDSLLGLCCDQACKDVSRGHYASYDPDATFREVTEPFHVCIEPSDTCIEPLVASIEPFEQRVAVELNEVNNFVHSFLTLYPASEGKRNTMLFRLACQAHKRGIPRQELVQAATQHMLAADFDAYEIAQVVNSAYSREVAPAGAKSLEKEGRTAPNRPFCPIGAVTSNTLDDETPENPDGEELRALTPLFPEEVYEGLPEFLTSVLKHHPEGRERDLLLLASITVLSSLFHTTSGYYFRRKHYPNLYTFIVAPPANNKSVITYALDLCKHFFDEAAKENAHQESRYKKELETYEYAIRQARRSKSKDIASEEIPVKPEEPMYYYPHIPTSLSQARLIEHLQYNGTRGGLMFDTEADTLTTSNGADCGQFQDMIRKIFHHERITSSYKVNGRPKYVDTPKLSMMVSGTPAQMVNYFVTTENGGYSRQLLYTYALEDRWQDVSPGSGDEELVERHFDELSMRLHQMLRFLHASSLRVTLSPAQWQELNTTFGGLLDNERFNDRTDFGSCIKRDALMAFRTCMVLTTLEKATLRMDVPRMECSDAHFRSAMALATTCLEHSRLAITSLKSTAKDVPELQNPNKLDQILASLPVEFTTQQFYDAAIHYKVSERTARKLLAQCNDKIISRIQKGVYRKRP